MFNGIIYHTGKINKIKKNKNNLFLEILSKLKFKTNEIGSSISCSGACLTLERKKNNSCFFYVSKETINKTNFKNANLMVFSDFFLQKKAFFLNSSHC